MKKGKDEKNNPPLENPELEREKLEQDIIEGKKGETLTDYGVAPLPSSTWLKF